MVDKIIPQNDLYNYINGKWIKSNKIPENESSWGIWTILRNKNDKIIKNIITNSHNTKYNILYNQSIDKKNLNKLGIKPIKPYLNLIKNEYNLTNLIASLHKIGINLFFNINSISNKQNSNIMIPILFQGGLSLPNKLYYFDKDKENIRKEYRKYIAKQLKNFNICDIENKVNYIYKIEKEIASISLAPEELRDIHKLYNECNINKLNKLINTINWNTYFNKINLKINKNFYIHNINYFQKLNNILKDKNIKVYLIWKVINNFSYSLNDKISNDGFNFYGKILNGKKKRKPQYKRSISLVNDLLGDELGKEYVKLHYNKNKEKIVTEMINNIKCVYKQRIQNLDWMSCKTKQKAILKLKKMTFKIGYPKKWKNFNKLNISNKNLYFENLVECEKFYFNDSIKECYKKKDKTKWEMYPQTINAYYHPANNEMVFPAAIFQKPFFDEDCSNMAMCYGGIGTVIAHEITHGFDDKGSLYDENGNLNNWWCNDDRQKFKCKTDKLVKQFNNYKLYDKNVNGELTLGENIADLGGCTISFHAFQKYMKDHSGKIKKSENKKFFYNFAKIWRVIKREESVKMQIDTDPHSPAIFRVNGTVINMPEFFETFCVKPSHKLYNKNPIQIW